MARYVMLIPNLSYDVKTNKAAKIDGLPIMLQSMVKLRSPRAKKDSQGHYDKDKL